MRSSGKGSIRGKGFLGVLLLAIIVFSIYLAYGIPAKPNSVTFTQNTSEHYANGNFSVNWTANTTLDNVSNYSIYVFNSTSFVLKAANTSLAGYLFNATVNNGNYTFNISAVNATGNEGENATSAWIFVDIQNASVNLTSPLNSLNTSNASVFFNFTASDNTLLNCSLYIDGALNQSNSSITDNAATRFNTTLAEGRHNWSVSCTDRANNTNTSAIYSIGIDINPPSITLSSPSNTQWDADGRLNFTFTALENVSLVNNCGLWLNTTGTWHQNMTNSSIINNTAFTFVFDNATNVLANGTYFWNVRCSDNATNSGWARENYTFVVGNAPDFAVSAITVNSSNAYHPDRPVPGSNLTLNVTIWNNGTAALSGNLTVEFRWDGTAINTTNITSLSSGASANMVYNISSALLSEGAHTARIILDPLNTAQETNETNNDFNRSVFTGLNIAILSITPINPGQGQSLLVNISAAYQDGDPVTNLSMANLTLVDYYLPASKAIPISNSSPLTNSSGNYWFNITAASRNSTTLRADTGNHTIRIFAADNSTGQYYNSSWALNGVVNSTDMSAIKYYDLKAPNLEAAFDELGSQIDISLTKTDVFNIRVKNNGTTNISWVNVSITSNLTNSLYYNSSNYSTGISCRYNETIAPTGTLTTICSPTFNFSAVGSYRLTAMAEGVDSNNTVYNSTLVAQVINVINSSGNGSSSSGTSATAASSSATLTYTLDFVNYTKAMLIEQGARANLTFMVRNNGNGTVNNVTLTLTLPDAASWGANWYNATNASKIFPGETVALAAKVYVPLNASIKTYTITAKVAGAETGSSKTATFVIQAIPGNETKEALNITLSGVEAEIAELNATILKLTEKGSNINITLASKKLAEVERLKLEAEQAILKGDYLTAYNLKNDIDTLIPEIRQILAAESKVVEEKKKSTQNIIIAAVIILAIIGALYYSWMPGEGYTPGKGFSFRAKGSSVLDRLKERLRGSIEAAADTSKQAVGNIRDKDSQDTRYLKPKEQPYSYSPKNENPGLNIRKMSRNVMEQLKEHGKSKGKPVYNFHKKQRWSHD